MSISLDTPFSTRFDTHFSYRDNTVLQYPLTFRATNYKIILYTLLNVSLDKFNPLTGIPIK